MEAAAHEELGGGREDPDEGGVEGCVCWGRGRTACTCSMLCCVSCFFLKVQKKGEGTMRS